MTMTVPTGFARLLASENISVRLDPNSVTASFNLESRVLTMPLWDASDRLRDMLIGHEVAHALFTTGDLMEHVAAIDPENFATAKDYLNVVEDARIDRLIQRKYAGLKADYRVGYREMAEKDFFGIGDTDIDTMPLIDRINLHFKHFENVSFSAIEQDFVDRIENVETIEEMIEVARDLYEWCRDNEEKQEETETVETNETGSGSGFGENDEDSADDDQQDGNGASDSAGSDDAEDDEDGKESPTGDSGDDAAGEEDSTSDSDSGDDDTGDEGEDGTAVKESFSKAPNASKTMKSMEDSLSKSVENNDHDDTFRNYIWPKKVDVDTAVYGYANILRDSDNEVGQADMTLWNVFKSAARGNVNNLAMLFERKKAAAVNARTQVAKTGRLDMTALHKYKMTEDIFLRNKVEIKGKNHGMVVYVDWSGSMMECMNETVQQTIVLAMFCKKVGIPFRVFGFNTWRSAEQEIFSYESEASGYTNMNLSNSFRLLEIFSDKMNNRDFEKMCAVLLKSAAEGFYYGTPRCLQMGGTPLNEAIVAGMEYAKQFRDAYRLDVMNSVFITDGCGGNPFDYWTSRDGNLSKTQTGESWRLADFNAKNIGGTDVLLRIYKDTVGGNLIGFYLDSKRGIERTIAYSSFPGTDRMHAAFKKDRFVLFPHVGYDNYFLMDKNIAVYNGSDKMDTLPDNASVTKAINAFKKDLGNRAASRPLLNTFTDKIAKEMV